MHTRSKNLVNNLSEGIHRIKFKYEHDDKKCETWGTKYKCYDCFLKYTNFKDDLIDYKCLYIVTKIINKSLMKFDILIYKFSNHNYNKFILLLRKGIYPYEYMYDLENSMKHHCLKKIFPIT